MILHSCCTTILHLTRLTSNGDLHFSHGWSLYFAPHQLQHDHDPPSLVLVIIHHFPSPSSFSMLVLASLYLFLLSCPCCYHDHGCRHYHSWCNTSTQCFDAQHPWQSQSSHTPGTCWLHLLLSIILSISPTVCISLFSFPMVFFSRRGCKFTALPPLQTRSRSSFAVGHQ